MSASVFPPPPQVLLPSMRSAGRKLLSLGLIDARNQTLRMVSDMERGVHDAMQANGANPAFTEGAPALPRWLAGHAGWFSEYWISRNTQRALGERCPSEPTRLASIEPLADAWWSMPTPDDEPPDLETTHAFLLETLETTLDLLDRTHDDDAALYFYRLALFHEDLCCEQLAVLAQTLGVSASALIQPEQVFAMRAPIAMPATRWQLGTPAGGFRFDNEAEPHEVSVPEFEIDAQAVTWSQYVEFVDDGGYDREEFWRPQGWQWLAGQVAHGRRGPRYVEQIGAASGAVMQQRFGRMVRMSGDRAAMHLCWWEADAWARWAGRRLASEVEWEVAAHRAAGQGFRIGEVNEWTATTFAAWPGFVPGPWAECSLPSFGSARVLRGHSFATPARLRHLKSRGFAVPARDDHFSGFRTCAV